MSDTGLTQQRLICLLSSQTGHTTNAQLWDQSNQWLLEPVWSRQSGDLLCWLTRALLALPAFPPTPTGGGPYQLQPDGQEPQIAAGQTQLCLAQGSKEGDTGLQVPLLLCSQTSLPAPHINLALVLPWTQGRTRGVMAFLLGREGCPSSQAVVPAPASLTLIRICRSSRSLPSHLSKGSKSCSRWLVGLTSTRCPLLSLGGCW